MPHPDHRRRHVSTRHFALRIEPHRLQLAIATQAKDQCFDIAIDEISCDQPGGWLAGNGSEAMVQALREWTEKHQFKRYPVAVSLDSGFCVTRVAMGAKEQVDRDLEMLHQRAPRYLQLGPGEKITASTRTTIAPGIDHVVTGVVNLLTVDALYDALCAAELRPVWFEPSLVSVARLVGCSEQSDEPILIADGSGQQWDIGVAYRGRLLLDYRPAGATCDEALLAALDGHITRIRRFCSRHRGVTNTEVSRLLIYGGRDSLSDTALNIAKTTGIDAKVLNTSAIEGHFRIETEHQHTRYVPAVATVLPLIQQMSVNEIPDMLGSIRRAPERPWPIRLAITLWPVVAASLFLLVSYSLVAAERRNEKMVLQNRELIETQMVQTQTRLADLTQKRRLLSQLEQLAETTQQPHWPDLFTHVSQCLPDNVRLSEFRVEPEGQVRVDGLTDSESTVYDVVDSLRRLPTISQVALQGTSPESSTQGTRFVIRLYPRSDPSRQ